MQTQPPPDAPAPPPSEAALRSRRRWRGIWIIGVGTILLLGVLAAPLFLRRRGTGCDQTAEVNNARQVGMALFEFEEEYGRFPDATTIAAVQADSGTTLPLGTKSSNDLFRQLIATGIAQSEPMFFAKINGSRKPDGVTVGARALSKGEVGFTYLAGGSASGNPSRPLILAPVIPGTDRFDPKAFKGKAVVLKLDNSVTSLPIQKDGHVLLNGQNILDPAHLVWEGKPPVIFYPDL